MATVFDVAKYILDKKGRVTSYELQKLCYYCKAWSLALGLGEMFPEEFQAWPHGPVCYDLFKEHKKEFIVTKADISKGDKDNISPSESDVIRTVLDSYAGMTGDDLEQKTHQEDPWLITRGTIPMNAACRKVIANDLMENYYRSSPEYEPFEDSYDFHKAERRESANSKVYSFAEMMDLLGITAEDIKEAEDIEFELG